MSEKRLAELQERLDEVLARLSKMEDVSTRLDRIGAAQRAIEEKLGETERLISKLEGRTMGMVRLR